MQANSVIDLVASASTVGKNDGVESTRRCFTAD